MSQHLQLEGGLDTGGLRCHAGSTLISVNPQTGDTTPCVTVHRPVIGNIFEDRLSLAGARGFCPESGITCVCDIHFQEDVVSAAADHARFVQISNGFTLPRDYRTELAAMRRSGVRFSSLNRIGIGEVRDDSRLFYTIEEVREKYRWLATGRAPPLGRRYFANFPPHSSISDRAIRQFESPTGFRYELRPHQVAGRGPRPCRWPQIPRLTSVCGCGSAPRFGRARAASAC